MTTEKPTDAQLHITPEEHLVPGQQLEEAIDRAVEGERKRRHQAASSVVFGTLYGPSSEL